MSHHTACQRAPQTFVAPASRYRGRAKGDAAGSQSNRAELGVVSECARVRCVMPDTEGYCLNNASTFDANVLFWSMLLKNSTACGT